MKSVLEILQSVNEEIDYENESRYISDGIMNSVDLLELITSLEDNFDISIPHEEIAPENFDSISAITLLIERLRKK